MWQRVTCALLALLGLAALLFATERDEERDADAAGQHVRFLPALAADSVPGATTPTATPTPPPGGGSSSGLVVSLIIRIIALELSVTPTGTTPVLIEAEAEVPMANGQSSSAAGGTFSIADHPIDAAGCSWNRVDVSTSFSVVVYNVSPAGILLGMTSAQWHYIQQCPGGAPPIRFPAFGEESLELFLRDVMAPYRTGVNEVLLPLNAAAAPGCLKQYGAFSHSGIQADPAQVYVYVHEQNCPLPPLLPLPQATPAPPPIVYP